MNNSRKVYREHQLAALDGMAHSRRDEMIRKGQYPRPAKVFEGGRANIWFDHEISAFQRWRLARRDGKAGEHSSWRDFLEPEQEAAPVADKQSKVKPRT
jgi:predicted DNA-binding transcriptional regulator AlpA